MRHRDAVDGDFAADWHMVTAARETLGNAASERIMTTQRQDQGGTVGFSIGKELRPRGRTSEARRISFVRSLDALIAVAGGGGTDQELALAVENQIPILPVPAFPGAALDYWKAYRSELIAALRIDEVRASAWEQPPPNESATLRALADEMVDALVNSLSRRCFIIMPYAVGFEKLYEQVITRAVRAAGDVPVLLKDMPFTGDAVARVHAGIENCEYAIAVLDNLRPNVMYELGLAHGQRKPTILLNHTGTLGVEGMAFDLLTLNRLDYEDIDDRLGERLLRMIQSLSLLRMTS